MDSGFMHPDEEPLTLAGLHGAMAYPTPLNDQELPVSAPASTFPAALGRWGPAAMDFTCYCRLASYDCNVLPAIAGGTRLRIRTLPRSTILSSNRSFYAHSALHAPLSLLPTLASFVAQLLASLHSYVDCARYTTSFCLPPPLDASAWVQIPLALVGDIVAY